MVECSEPWTTVTGKGKRRFISSGPSSTSLWIERKIFCAFPLIPGRTIRVVEVLSDRRFSVDFKSNELPWLISVLREEGKANTEVSFSKEVTIGPRSMALSTVSNRAGVFIKLLCTFGGKNRRLLFIPAGENGGGWSELADLLASVSAGGSNGAKKSVSSSIKHSPSVAHNSRRDTTVVANVSFAEAVSGKPRPKDHLIFASDWKEGFLPELLELGLNLSLGAPSSSSEASRRFTWRTVQSELGSGTLVVEKGLGISSPCWKSSSGELELGCEKISSGGVATRHIGSVAGVGFLDETRLVVEDDDGGGDRLGISHSPIQNSTQSPSVNFKPNTASQEGGPPLSTGLHPFGSENSRGVSPHVEQVGLKDLWVGDSRTFISAQRPESGPDVRSPLPADPSLADFGQAGPQTSLSFNSVLGSTSGGPSQVSGLVSLLVKPLPLCHVFTRKANKASLFAPALRVAQPRGSFVADGLIFSPVTSAGSSPAVLEVPSPHGGGSSPRKGGPLFPAADLKQTLLAFSPLPTPFASPYLHRLRNVPTDLRSLASHAEITLSDSVDGEDSMASPQSVGIGSNEF